MEPLRRFVDSDNSCLFSSIGYLIDNNNFNDTTKLQYRQLLVNYLESTKLEEGILEIPKPDYLENIQNPSTWGGAIELKLFSDMFQGVVGILSVLTLFMSDRSCIDYHVLILFIRPVYLDHNFW